MKTESDLFPRKYVPIDLKPNGAAALTVDILTTELGYVGLNCREARGKRVLKHMDEVIAKIPFQSNQAYGIYECNSEQLFVQTNEAAAFEATAMCPFYGVENAIDATWTVDPDGLGYVNELYQVLHPVNFARLKEHFTDFVYIETTPQTTESVDTTASAVVNFFGETLTTVASTMIGGICEDDLKAACTEMISRNTSTDENYTLSKSFVVYLVGDYDEETGNAQEIGAVWYDYTLEIKNYENKKASDHKATLTVQARSVQYTDISILEKHLAYLATCKALGDIPPKPLQISVYDIRPEASPTVYSNGIPQEENGVTLPCVLVLHSPELDEVGMVDNTSSETSVSYSITVTSGFTESETLAIGVKTYAEVSCTVTKAGVSLEMTSTVTSQSTQTRSETVTYNVPAGTSAYLYQGYMNYSMLNLLDDGSYQYAEEAEYRTNIIKTSNTPLT